MATGPAMDVTMGVATAAIDVLHRGLNKRKSSFGSYDMSLGQMSIDGQTKIIAQ